MKNLAIITARSGSKGVVDKNVRLLDGKPLLAYSIEAALKSKMFEEIMVSTDSEKYAELAKKFGASVPFLRSCENSDDDTSSWDVVREVLKKYEKLGKRFDTVALLQPTSPLREAEDIIQGYQLFREKKADSIIGVCEVEHSPLHCNVLGDNLLMYNFIRPDVYMKPRQRLPQYYRINGALYIMRVKERIYIPELYNDKCFAYIMPKERSIDIDTELDLKIVEVLQKNKDY